MRKRFKHIGRSDAYGEIYAKGKIQIIVYYPDSKEHRKFRYWPYGCPGDCWQRDKNGMDFHFRGKWLINTPK